MKIVLLHTFATFFLSETILKLCFVHPLLFPFAVASTDYGELSMSLVFRACETISCTDVTIVNDNWPGDAESFIVSLPEDAESFIVSLRRSSVNDEWLSIYPAEATIEIQPNDG